ncbi:MAG: hypothetical protein M0008_11070 [Actinomycetota bacterium]|nr:hypothetical protein [Actinomycetota bacterium]
MKATLAATESPGTSGGPPTWAQDSSQNNGTNQNNYLNGVSCTSSTSCIAVGDYVDSSGVYQTLIEQYNGTSWSIIQSSPNTSTSESNYLNGVSCTSSTSCTAVGDYVDSSGVYQTLIEQYNGSTSPPTVSIQSSPNTSTSESNYLNSATCVSSTECYAAGYYVNSSGLAQTLIDYWNGTSWTVATSSNANNGNNYLYGVSCVSSNECFAAGYYVDSSGVDQVLFLYEAGSPTKWAVGGSLAGNVGSGNNYLYGISCPSSDGCYAAGYYYDTSLGVDQTLVDYWCLSGTCANNASVISSGNESGGVNGGGGPSSTAPANNYLYGISCSSSTSCYADGSFQPGYDYQTIVESGNNSGFAISTSANGTTESQGSFSDQLRAISCTTSTSCDVVGHFSYLQTLVESWNSSTFTWSIVTSPNNTSLSNGTPPVDNSLNGVSCVSSSFCVAAGAYFNVPSNQFSTTGFADYTLIEQYNGSNWSIVNSPNPDTSPSSLNQLMGVDCVSSTSCIAVGDSQAAPTTSGTQQPVETLAEIWNGTSWSTMTSQNPSTSANYLNGISCVSSSSCVATGFYINSSGAPQTLVEYWNGTSWVIQTSPNTSTSQDNFLYGVSCASSTSCEAVGDYIDSSGVYQTLIEYWNGTSWVTQTSPNTSTSLNNFLYGVSCSSSSSCMTVGGYVDSSGATETLAESRNGTSWSIPTTPNPSSTMNALNGVTCASSASCLATGFEMSASGISQTLAEQWG